MTRVPARPPTEGTAALRADRAGALRAGTADVLQLPASWRTLARDALPELARTIVEQIGEEVPEYRLDPDGRIHAETRETVTIALQTFMQTALSGRPLTGELADVFRRVGRNEALAGRSHDPLQAAYRVASSAVMHQILDWERRYPTSRATVAAFSSAMFTFIDGLARLTAEGYASAQPERVGRARERSRLVAALVQPGSGRSAIAQRASAVGWPLPVECAVIEVLAPAGCEDDVLVGFAQDACGPDAVAALVGGRHVVVDPGPVDLERVRRAIAWQGTGFRAFVGPRVELVLAAESAALARRARYVLDDVAKQAGGVLCCDEHLLALFGDDAAEVCRALASRYLQPLMGLGLAKRVKYARLLSAWLEFGSLHGDAPGVLDKHRQTLRYQVARLEQLFGDSLRDRDARLGMMLALRRCLPDWESGLDEGDS